ncbi:MAG: chromate efflux transporter [Planctomycetia bacterium]|nr:chromate efflux transporter [Planctomycetia bacterium]
MTNDIEVEPAEARPPQAVSLREALPTWCRVAALSFGGPAGQIAVMHRILVDEKKWISEERFLHALNYCMLLPGPEAQQLATYIGWLMHRTAGGLLAGTLFILPGFLAIMLLSIVYATFQQTPLVQALFFGLKPAVMAIVVEAVLRIGKRVLKNGTMVAIAALSFIAIFFFEIPFPLVIIAAGIVGYLGGRIAPDRFHVISGHGKQSPGDSQGPARIADRAIVPAPTWRRAAFVSGICLPLWFGPIVAVRLLLGPSSVFYHEATFFSQAAMVTFGGAYSVLAYVAQQAVEHFRWLRPGEMLDGLGMAETTPGPLIIVVEFVGFLGAYRHPEPFAPLTAGIIGAVLTTWVTFVPCFYWIFLGAPYIERLRGNKNLSAALSTITAAVVGVILNLAVWFSLHTLFGSVSTTRFYGTRFLLPDFGSLHAAIAAIAVLAMLMTFYWKRGLATTLAVCGLLGVAAYYFVPPAWH